ncbi:MAG: M28 family peptidase [Acidobacteriota bacterium]
MRIRFSPGSRAVCFCAAMLAPVHGASGQVAPEAPRIRAVAATLAADEFAGRAPGTAGGDRAETYLARTMKSVGLEPMGDGGGYLQAVPMHASRPLPESAVQLITPCTSRWLRLGQEFLLHTSDPGALAAQPVSLVFAGYGIVAPEFDYNDYAGLDVRGAIAVVLDGEPPSRDPGWFGGERATIHASVSVKQRVAMSRGAVGTVALPSRRSHGDYDWESSRRTLAGEDLTLAYSTSRGLNLALSPEVAPLLFCGAAVTFEEVLRWESTHTMRSFPLAASLRPRLVSRERDFRAANVVGLVRGRDPKLSATAVVVSAHHDHLGLGPAVDGDTIYNGMVDNALGVAGALEIARVLAAGPERPRRSVLVVLTTGEERGLLGSSYFLGHPPLPLENLVANVNVDGLAFAGRFRDVVPIGGELSTLGGVVREVAAKAGLEIARPPAAFEHAHWFAFSDQQAFAEAGVPAVLVNEGFTLDGVSTDEAVARAVRWGSRIYHSPDDEPDQPLDFSSCEQHVGLLVELVRSVADDPQPPRWHPGSPYALARLRASR